MNIQVSKEAAAELEEAVAWYEEEEPELKKLILHRFPFSLVIFQSQQMMAIVAFAHYARKPGYWTERVRP